MKADANRDEWTELLKEKLMQWKALKDSGDLGKLEQAEDLEQAVYELDKKDPRFVSYICLLLL